MYLFQFSLEETLTFFAVLVRYSVLFALIPITGDRMVSAPIKVLLSLAVTLMIFPVLVRSGQVRVEDALVWGSTVGGITRTVGLEAFFGLILGFVSRLAFEALNFAANLAGQFMGLSAASSFDPSQESQSQIVAQMQMAVATLLFLALEGHHLLFKSVIDSYSSVGLGALTMSASVSDALIKMTAEVFLFGVQVAAPITVSISIVNVVFGVMSKAMPQMNILALSFGITVFMGFFVAWLGMAEYGASAGEVFARGHEWLEGAKKLLGAGA